MSLDLQAGSSTKKPARKGRFSITHLRTIAAWLRVTAVLGHRCPLGLVQCRSMLTNPLRCSWGTYVRLN